MDINCPSTALAKRWGYIYRAPLICQRYVISSIENLHFTSTDLSVGVSAGTQPPSGLLGQNATTTAVHRRLVDSDQGENNHPNPPNHQNQFDGVEASVTPEGSAAHAQATPFDVPPHQPPQPEDPLVVPQVPQRAPMEVVMAALVNTINKDPPRDIPRRQNHSPPQRNNHISPPRNRRSPPRRNNRSPPRNGEAAARGGNARLEKPPTLDKYDGTTDPDEHVQSIETALDYRNLRGTIKCKLFPLSLVRGASTWWRNLPPGSIDSWEELCRMFTAYFTTSRRHPKTVASLKAIVQGPEESLRNYIERFNKVSVEVEATDKMKLYLLEEGLREGTKFQEAVGILEVQTLDAFFELAQRYIKYEDKQKASEVRRPKTSRILSEISSAEFKSAGIRFLKQLPAKPNVDKKLFCRFHKSYGHVTEDCVHLKDAIEILIQKGYARQYVDGQPRTANNNAPRQNQLGVDPASPKQHIKEENRENFPGALVISGGGFNPITIGSIKRKFDELEKASPVEEIKITEVKESSVPLAFYREEVPGGSPNFQIPLLVRAKMANFDLKACLRENAELFAWSAAEMPGIDPEVACHQLTIDPRASAVVQRRRKQSPEKAEAARKAVKDLLEANFIAEAQACPKDAYPLPNIDKLVDNSSGFKLLSFMDAYSGYNEIKMAEIDKKKTAFMTETGNYYYNVMPFGLKNAGATYQRMMNKVFHNEIGDMLEVYMDDMIVKSEEEIDHTVHLKRVFDQARKFNMRFNPEKCTFGVKAGKFLGFYLTERGIEANPDKCIAFFDYPTPKSKKSIQTLNGMLTSMARFVAKSAQHALPLFKLLRKETTFELTEECEGALQHLKRALSEPPVLTRPTEGEKLYLYLAVASEAISAVLIRETEQVQKPVYFVSRALQEPELRYLQKEKIALAVIMAARKLRYYFLAHSIVIRTDQPVKQLLARPDMVGRMLKWSLELAEFDISFESIKALKAQVLADFVAEMTTSPTSEKNKWTIFVDGSSNSQGSGVGIILENGDGVLIEVSLGLSFPTTNNQAEYIVFLAGLRLAEDMGAEEIKIFTENTMHEQMSFQNLRTQGAKNRAINPSFRKY
ncbi:hypothetical protein TSUD_30400 [Trifolium subterraneum]|uniref:RNase H type-1 domain-containing protein n=1 Tax=Trifolium subterraneum TaxID=3900 RepID=A0A2Z6N0R3_TRISU|nr:hypothetical protein TSUD_30400 [Trifolium subterraneum]